MAIWNRVWNCLPGGGAEAVIEDMTATATETRKPPSPVAQAIIDSLASHPEKWWADGDWLWIGNKESSLAPVKLWIGVFGGCPKLNAPWAFNPDPIDTKWIKEAYDRWVIGPTAVRRFRAVLHVAEQAGSALEDYPTRESVK